LQELRTFSEFTEDITCENATKDDAVDITVKMIDLDIFRPSKDDQ